ncbi:hypothetical protein DINM_001008 [Dirofilaria immitis]|nr:hypothetical protein [Dirofilaria immitis]
MYTRKAWEEETMIAYLNGAINRGSSFFYPHSLFLSISYSIEYYSQMTPEERILFQNGSEQQHDKHLLNSIAIRQKGLHTTDCYTRQGQYMERFTVNKQRVQRSVVEEKHKCKDRSREVRRLRTLALYITVTSHAAGVPTDNKRTFALSLLTRSNPLLLSSSLTI